VTGAEREARSFGRYLLGRAIDQPSVRLYSRYVTDDDCSDRDGAIVAFAARHPWSIAALDAALAVTRPDAPLRRRLLFLAAILETRPQWCDAFLPRERGPAYVITAAGIVLRAALCALAGFALLPFVR